MTRKQLSRLSARHPHLISFTDADLPWYTRLGALTDRYAPKTSFGRQLLLVIVGCSILAYGMAVAGRNAADDHFCWTSGLEKHCV